jgi:hypothetical protein
MTHQVGALPVLPPCTPPWAANERLGLDLEGKGAPHRLHRRHRHVGQRMHQLRAGAPRAAPSPPAAFICSRQLPATGPQQSVGSKVTTRQWLYAGWSIMHGDFAGRWLYMRCPAIHGTEPGAGQARGQSQHPPALQSLISEGISRPFCVSTPVRVRLPCWLPVRGD